MRLFAVHAFCIDPRRTKGGPSQPAGGPVRVTPALRAALAEAANFAHLKRTTLVDLVLDPHTRTGPVRDSLLQFAFGSGTDRGTAAIALATRLCGAMDLRSKPCLFIIAAEEEEARRRLTAWTFPRDEAFQFQGSPNHSSIKLLSDVFSRTSHLRKVALFEGGRRPADFISGRVLDLQANAASRAAADLWISTFLEARLAIAREAGTRLLANSIRRAYKESDDPEAKEQLHAAIVAIRQSPRRRWSFVEFADTYLKGDTHDRFVSMAGDDETVHSLFDFDRESFDRTLNYRVFRLDTNVYVSVPFDEIDKSVKISGEKERRLKCEGIVVDDQVRVRRA